MRQACLLLSAVLVVSGCATTPLPGHRLPIVELPSKTSEDPDYFAIFLTGDGGWRKIDAKVSDVLRANGVPVVGLLSNLYFAHERTPEEAAADLDSLIAEYSTKWGRRRVILVGYSRGADALPIIVNRLPAASRQSVAVVALLGIGLRGSLWVEGPDKYPLGPEVSGLRGIPLVCVYGTQEKESLCRSLGTADARIIAIPGGHHFGGDYGTIGRTILASLTP